MVLNPKENKLNKEEKEHQEEINNLLKQILSLKK